MVGLVLSLVSLGCGGTPMDQQIPINRSRRYERSVDTLGVEGIVPASGAKVWEVLPAVLTDLGLDINFREPAGRRIGACYQKVRARLAKAALSTFLDCGETRGIPNADRFEVALTVLVTVVPSTAQTAKIYTFVLGVGVDGSGTSSNRLWCYSKGTLEERIRTGVEDRLRS
jgi:hypothetical protein